MTTSGHGLCRALTAKGPGHEKDHLVVDSGFILLAVPAQAGDRGNFAQLLKQGHSNFGVSADYLIGHRFQDYALGRRYPNDGTECGYRSSPPS
ncbi:hypothetical protein DFAR_1690007 [Desulfarculales bacterium]